MRSVRIILCIFSFLSTCALAQPSDSQTLIDQVAALLDQSGLKYSKLIDGKWAVSAKGKNLKNFEVILSADQQTVTATVKIASRDDIAAEGPLTELLNELNEKYKMAKFSLDKISLIVRTDLPNQRMDKESFIKFIEHTKGVVDESYPKIHPHLSPAASSGIKPPMIPVPTTVEPQVNPAVDPPIPANPAVDTKPVALNNPEPDYTETARSKGVQGIVRVRVLVGEDGLVKNARILRGLPDGLNDEAVKAAFKIRFRPAMKEGQAVRYWVTVEIKFNLR